MIQSLSAFCFYSGSLRAVENMREFNRTVLIRALLTPYANRPWAMTNLILVRFWKGCGFGFRYSHVYPSKFLQSLRKDRIQDPSPSIKYQQEIGRYLSKNLDDAIVFLNSLLGQLNWAFSEFMGLLKDVILLCFFLFEIFYYNLVGTYKISLYANN
jgi:Kip1 ubiquitination-promoting complex protein 1